MNDVFSMGKKLENNEAVGAIFCVWICVWKSVQNLLKLTSM